MLFHKVRSSQITDGHVSNTREQRAKNLSAEIEEVQTYIEVLLERIEALQQLIPVC